MPTLPWTNGSVTTPPGEVTVLASRLDLRRHRDVPGFLRAAMGLHRRLGDAPGSIGLTLRAEPLRRRFWTLSAWTDDDAVRAYVSRPEHRAVMERFGPAMAGSQFATWRAPGAERPTWAEAQVRLTSEAPSP
ncbi:MAG: DUF3291 domain-containing protein [Acidimicrobiales bacterium]